MIILTGKFRGRRGKVFARIAAFLPLFFIVTPIFAQAGDEFQAMPGFAGYSGLWDMPNARLLPDWNMRVGWSISYPYSCYHAALGLFDVLEINGRVTGIAETNNLDGSGGDYKDKALDIKIKLLSESGRRPALVLGANDIHGTGLFTSRYIAFSKRAGAVDITWGLGQGMMGGQSAADRMETISGDPDDPAMAYIFGHDLDYRWFWGFEWAVNEKLRLTGEYSSISWEKVAGGHEEDSHVNLGLKYNLWRNLYLNLAYARGEELSGGLFFEFPLEPEGLTTWKKEPGPVRQEKIRLEAARADDRELARLLAAALEQDGFRQVKVTVLDSKLWVELENTRYNSSGLAMGRLFKVADGIAPERISRLYFVLTREGIFQTGLAASRSSLGQYVKSGISTRGLLEFISVVQSKEDLWSDFNPRAAPVEYACSSPAEWSVCLEPVLSSYVNDPSGCFRTRFSLDVTGEARPWTGGVFTARLSLPVYNNVSASDVSEESEPDGLGTADYLSRETPSLTGLGFDQIIGLPGSTRARVSFGAFEASWAGVGVEIFKYFSDGRYGVGAQSEWVWKRDLENDFSLDDDKKPYHTGLLNLYGQPFGRSGLEIGLRLGRFLAGDNGVRLEVCRTYKHFTVGAWYSATETSGFKSCRNRDYHDQGVFITWPLSVIKDAPVYGRYRYEISSWPGDPGQMVRTFRSLYPLGTEGESAWSVQDSLREMR